MKPKIKRRRQPDQHALAQSQLPELLQRVYANRGVTDPADLEMSMQRLLPPDSLLGVTAAAELIYNTIKHQQAIMIVGDYDADGATSTALAMRGLRALGAQNVGYIVPDRFKFGYGLTPEIVDLAQKSRPKLIITVDNGISSHSGAQRARQLGIDLLITDHHLPGQTLPAACVIVNPNQPGDRFASKSLAGVGVMFYVLIALRRYLRARNWFENLPEPNFAELLDLVALGTVADVVPLDKNNRILVEQGLRRIRAGRACPGIKKLLEVAGCDAARAVSSDLAFYAGPRINAAGRLQDMSAGIECLLAGNAQAAEQMALRLQALNAERKDIENQMRAEALTALRSGHDGEPGARQQNQPGICVYQADWHQGVIGILAARIKEKYYRPTIVFANDSGHQLKGSARSIAGVHIRDVLDNVAANHPHLITKFGGHAMAAGLSLPRSHYEAFVAAFNDVLKAWLSPAMLRAEILSDGELDEADINLAMARRLRNSGPWGQGFPTPVFDGEFNVLDYRTVGEHHLKLSLQTRPGGPVFSAIAFNYANFDWHQRAALVHVAYELDVNHYRGIESAQLLIRYLQVRARR